MTDIRRAAGKRRAREETGLLDLPDGRCRASWCFEGRWVRRILPNRTLARQARNVALAEIIEGRYFPRRIKEKKEEGTSFSDAADKFEKWSKTSTRPSTHACDARFVKRWKKHFEGKALGSIGAADVEEYKAQQAAGNRCHKTVDNDLARLKRLFSLAVKWHLCHSNPVKEVDFFKPESLRDRFLTVEEESRILELAPPSLRPPIVFSLSTGLRQGELVSLTWGQVDLKRGRLGQVTVTAERAKGKRTRHIPLNQTARAVIDSLPRAISKAAPVFPVFEGSKRLLKSLWEPVQRRANLEGVCWHTLRHTFTSRLVMAGVDLVTVQKLLGHTTLTMVLKYAHLAPGHLEAGAFALDRYQQDGTNISLTFAETRTPGT